MSLSRESRILILLGVFGLGAVVVLMAMADKYRTMLDPAAPAASGSGSPQSDTSRAGVIPPFRGKQGSAAEAEDRVRRYLAVRRTLAEASRTLVGSGGAVGSATMAQIRGHRDLALERVGLALGDYVRMRDGYVAWSADGDAGSERLNRAFADVRDELAAAEAGIHPSLEL